MITINGEFPGPLVRMREGEEALIRVHNGLNESTSIHWHGILLPFDMDGVPGISFPGIAPGEVFTYRFRVRQAGTYWYHSHSGFQEQLGLYGSIIVDPEVPEPFEWDVDCPVVLSDWTPQRPERIFHRLKKIEGYFNFQRPTLSNIADQARHSGMSQKDVVAMRLRWERMRMDPTDLLDVTGVTYSYLLNGLPAEERPTLPALPGQRVRLRLINAAAMTYFDVRVPGLPMTLVQADGQNVEPVETDELRIAVAETYDVLVTLPDDLDPCMLFAETMDRSGFTMATFGSFKEEPRIPERRPRPMLGMEDMGMMHGAGTSDHSMPHVSGGGSDHDGSVHSMQETVAARHEHHPMDGEEVEYLPLLGLPDSIPHGRDGHGPASITMARMAYRQLDDPGVGLGEDGWRVMTYRQLRALTPLPDRRAPDREIHLHLTGNMERYIWGFDGLKWSDADLLRFVYGERLRIHFHNDTMMSHPIHLHGMWMDLYAGHEYGKNPRKHTVNVQPAELVTVDVTVDAPGQWAFHCHLLYHMEAGMFRTVAVVRSLEGQGGRHED